MYADLGPGQTIDLDAPSPSGSNVLYSHQYVANRRRSRPTLAERTNLYGYTTTNPVNHMDPSGLQETPGSGGLFSSVGSSCYSMGQTYYAFGQYAWGNTAGGNQTMASAYANGPLGQAEVIGPGTYNATAGSLGVATAATAGAVIIGGGEIAFLGNQSMAEFNVLSSGNVAKVISRPFKCGFRVDPAHHGKPWGHTHWWWWK